MEFLATALNTLGGLFTIVVFVLSFMVIISLFVKKSPPFIATFTQFLTNKSLMLSFFVALVATIGSLIYSDVLGYEPCKLCWVQRIFIYPQVVILGLALWKRDDGARLSSLVLAGIGACVALYQYLGQLGFNPFQLECLAIGTASSCAKNYVLQFGFVSIPMMSFAIFLAIIVLQILWMKKGEAKRL